jgi:hypothetical protein
VRQASIPSWRFGTNNEFDVTTGEHWKARRAFQYLASRVLWRWRY